MRTKFIKLAAIAFICTTTARVSQAYNLSPISFENFYRIAADGDLQGLKDVQRRGLNLDSTNMHGDTAVCVAIKRQDYLAYKTLIRAGAKSNPDCVESIPEYAHKNFLANYNQKYAAPKTPTNWTKNGTAFLVGGGIAAGIVALAGSGGGGGGSKGSSNADDASNTAKCDLNPCAEGCYENITCAAGYQCTQYESKCNLGCTKCEQKPECANVPECTKGCYTNLTCQSGYTCTKYNKCSGCDKCEKVTEIPDTSNSRNCKDFNSSKNYCNTCDDGYTSVNGSCKQSAPEHCSNYDVSSETCSVCETGYKLSANKRVCLVDAEIDPTTCTAANYPLQSCPTNAQTCDNCTPTGATSPIYKINACKTGYTLSSDKKSCDAIPAGTCTAANYPLTTAPTNAAYESCLDGSTPRYRITSCNTGYTLSSDGKSCVVDSTKTCNTTIYPLTSCPSNAFCLNCTDSSGTHYLISQCTNGTNPSADNTRCETTCDTTSYPLSACPAGAVCGSCTDANGTHNKFLKCMAGYTQDGLNEACVQQQITENSTDVINDTQLTVSGANSTIVDTTTVKKWRLGFTNYTADGKTVNSNLYNAYSTDASITINQDNFDSNLPLAGLASMYSNIPVTINAYKHSGTINITTNSNNIVYGILSSGTAYNSYNGNGTIKLIRNFTDSNEQGYRLVGMGVNYEYLNDISGLGQKARHTDYEKTFLYNAFGGTGLIQIEATQGEIIGMRGENAINAAEGGSGTIKLTGYKKLYGIGYNDNADNNTSIKINAYSSNNQDTVGKIVINNNNLDSVGVGTAVGIYSNNLAAYNAYGKGAIGYITINGAGIGMHNGNNAGNEGTGYITINTNVENQKLYEIIGIEGSQIRKTNYNGVGTGSKGYIDITVDKEITKGVNDDYTEAVYGVKDNVDNGSPDGGVGSITITDTGNNNIIGINGGGNHKNSVVKIKSNADSTKSIYGITDISLDTSRKATLTAFTNQNYGTINITLRDSGNAYGIYASENVLNSGNITITNSRDDSTSQAYGIYSVTPNNNNLNTGSIILEYGIKTVGLVNVNNGIGGYINLSPVGPLYTYVPATSYFYKSEATGILASRPNNYSADEIITITNGSAASPATSASDSKNGYIFITGSGRNQNKDSADSEALPNLVGIRGATNTNIFNYGVISLSGNSIAGILNEYSGKIYNYGFVNIVTKLSTALGIYGSSDTEIYNEKDIILTSSMGAYANRRWYGIYGGTATNNGTITMNINDGYEAKAMSGTIVTNNGNILFNTTSATASLGISNNSYKNSYLTNNGNIQINSGSYFTYGIYAIYGELSDNTYSVTAINSKTGTISIDNISAYTAYGMYADNKALIQNSGKITINNSANARGMSADEGSTAQNDGSITLDNITGNAYGIYSNASNVVNTGSITLTDVDESNSYGIYAVNGSKVYNSGTITINGESYNKNEADGKFIYIDNTSSMVNEGEISTTSLFDTNALGGGKFALSKNGKISAPKVKGTITADAEITSGGFDKTYANTDAFSGDTSEVKLNSGSALFDVTLKDNDIVMTMKDFDEVVDDKSLAAYLQRNYDAKRNEDLFNSLKLHATASSLNNSLNQQLGFSLLPNFAQENMNVFRSLSNLVTDTMFAQDLTNERMMVGYDYLGQDRSNKGRVTGYENTANSAYFLADTKLNNRQRFGLGVALTRFNSDYDDDSSRKATLAQALASYMHDFGNSWKYAGLLRAGYADGDYKRQNNGTRISGDTSDILYGFNNELRYSYDLGLAVLEPQLELNASGYYQRKIKEDNAKTDALQIKGTNNLSLESGAGLYLSKEAVYGENGHVKGRLGGSYYRELSQPYHTMRARVNDTEGYYLIESTDIFDRDRIVVRADITFSWKALDFYLRGSQFMENKHTTVINAGIKYNF